MLVDPVTARSITINVTNSGHPGTVWSSVVTRNTYNTPYRCENCGKVWTPWGGARTV